MSFSMIDIIETCVKFIIPHMHTHAGGLQRRSYHRSLALAPIRTCPTQRKSLKSLMPIKMACSVRILTAFDVFIFILILFYRSMHLLFIDTSHSQRGKSLLTWCTSTRTCSTLCTFTVQLPIYLLLSLMHPYFNIKCS